MFRKALCNMLHSKCRLLFFFFPKSVIQLEHSNAAIVIVSVFICIHRCVSLLLILVMAVSFAGFSRWRISAFLNFSDTRQWLDLCSAWGTHHSWHSCSSIWIVGLSGHLDLWVHFIDDYYHLQVHSWVYGHAGSPLSSLKSQTCLMHSCLYLFVGFCWQSSSHEIHFLLIIHGNIFSATLFLLLFKTLPILFSLLDKYLNGEDQLSVLFVTYLPFSAVPFQTVIVIAIAIASNTLSLETNSYYQLSLLFNDIFLWWKFLCYSHCVIFVCRLTLVCWVEEKKLNHWITPEKLSTLFVVSMISLNWTGSLPIW